MLVEGYQTEIAMEWHRSFEADVQSLLQQAASRPAAPVVLKAAGWHQFVRRVDHLRL